MVYNLLRQIFPILGIIDKIIFKTIFSFLTSFILTIFLGKYFLKFSKYFKSLSRSFIKIEIEKKNQTPSMGGIFIIISSLISIILWNNIFDITVILSIITILLFFLIGFIDDYYKLKYKKGINAKTKISLQIISAIIIAIIWYNSSIKDSSIYLPFFKNIKINIGYLSIFWISLIIISTSNAVNLTDGLDGLAIGSLIPNFILFSIFTYIKSNEILSNELNIKLCNCNQLSIIAAILAGSSLGFMWYNAYPAYIFMGDTGSLTLGAILGLIAAISKHEYILIISGGIFIIETISVILQVISYKYRKKRIFKMSPIHHHFQLIGYPENIIAIRFTIISIILSLIALIII